MSTTEIKLGVVRTIKTAEFESLHITAEITEKVEWENEKERTKGIDIAIGHLNRDFRRAHVVITGSVGVTRSLGTGKLVKKDGTTHTANVEADDEIDMFGD